MYDITETVSRKSKLKNIIFKTLISLLAQRVPPRPAAPEFSTSVCKWLTTVIFEKFSYQLKAVAGCIDVGANP